VPLAIDQRAEPGLVRELNVTAFPTMLIISESGLLGRMTGFVPPQQMRQRLSESRMVHQAVVQQSSSRRTFTARRTSLETAWGGSGLSPTCTARRARGTRCPDSDGRPYAWLRRSRRCQRMTFQKSGLTGCARWADNRRSSPRTWSRSAGLEYDLACFWDMRRSRNRLRRTVGGTCIGQGGHKSFDRFCEEAEVFLHAPRRRLKVRGGGLVGANRRRLGTLARRPSECSPKVRPQPCLEELQGSDGCNRGSDSSAGCTRLDSGIRA
jgi:hypothetical protein